MLQFQKSTDIYLNNRVKLFVNYLNTSTT